MASVQRLSPTKTTGTPAEKRAAYSAGVLVLALCGGALAATLYLLLGREHSDTGDIDAMPIRSLFVPTLAVGVLAVVSVLISACDRASLRIPNWLLACAACTVLFAAGAAKSVAGMGGGGSAPLFERVSAVGLPCLLLVAVWWVVPAGIGTGDVKLGAVAAAGMVGFGEAPWLRAGVLLCCFACALALQNLHRRRIRAQITAAGPWLVCAAWAAALLMSPGLGALAATGSVTG